MEESLLYCNVLSATIHGLEARMVNVEVDVDRGLPSFDMTGFLASEVKEARERVKVAIKNAGIELPPMKIVVNISPANLRKGGTGFDLPIALAVLVSLGIIDKSQVDNTMIIGELSLNGRVNSVRGILPCVCKCKEQGIGRSIIPVDNYTEASIVGGLELICIESLSELIDFFKSDNKEYSHKGNKHNNVFIRGDCNKEETNIDKEELYNKQRTSLIDYSDIRGQNAAKRATMIAVAGMHNLMYIGPPGSGKTMMAKRIPTIMPKLSYEESLEVTKVYSVAGKLKGERQLITDRPYRSPHHNVTVSAMTGGGRIPVPGEITLAGKGVLFLDEMTEFKTEVLEALRQPLEDRVINIVRSGFSYVYPADFMLVGAMNPCKCGYYPDRNRCNCSDEDINRYMGKLSNPMWDRFDICVRTQELGYEDISSDKGRETVNEKNSVHSESSDMSNLIIKARRIQRDRFKDSGIDYNAQMGVSDIRRYCKLGEEESRLMERMYKKLRLTARGYHKLLKTARTIADLDGEDNITCEHLTEAAFYRH